jgi:hypothetical protein
MRAGHTKEDIADELKSVIELFGIANKLGYFILDRVWHDEMKSVAK